MSRAPRRAALALCCAGAVLAIEPQAALAFNPAGPLCSAAGWVSGLAGKACEAVSNAPKILSAGKKLLSGRPGAAAKAVFGGGPSTTSIAVGLASIGAWVLVGARVAMHETATLISHTTSPALLSGWFSGAYWRMAAIAAVLTLPFLFAAAIQALIRSDLALLLRAALGYLPLAFLAVSIAAPVAMLLLAASDQMSAAVSAAAGHDGVLALDKAGGIIGGISALAGSPFLAFLVGLFAVAGAVVLWLELLMREAAIYVVVLMLPLAFAALVWPARRVWALRAVEVLVALILSKFAIVAVLTLAAAALGHSISQGPTAVIAGAALVILGAYAPWALLRLVPLAEIASTTAGTLRGSFGHARQGAQRANVFARQVGGAVEGRAGDPSEGDVEVPRASARDAALHHREQLDKQTSLVTASRNGGEASLVTAPHDGGEAPLATAPRDGGEASLATAPGDGDELDPGAAASAPPPPLSDIIHVPDDPVIGPELIPPLDPEREAAPGPEIPPPGREPAAPPEPELPPDPEPPVL